MGIVPIPHVRGLAVIRASAAPYLLDRLPRHAGEVPLP
jgi:hypothetical protein